MPRDSIPHALTTRSPPSLPTMPTLPPPPSPLPQHGVATAVAVDESRPSVSTEHPHSPGNDKPYYSVFDLGRTLLGAMSVAFIPIRFVGTPLRRDGTVRNILDILVTLGGLAVIVMQRAWPVYRIRLDEDAWLRQNHRIMAGVLDVLDSPVPWSCVSFLVTNVVHIDLYHTWPPGLAGIYLWHWAMVMTAFTLVWVVLLASSRCVGDGRRDTDPERRPLLDRNLIYS